jgi:hypothetical protein
VLLGPSLSSGFFCSGSTRGSAGLGLLFGTPLGTPFGGSLFGTPFGTSFGCQPGGLALGGGLFRGGLLYRGATGCPLGLTLCLLPRRPPLCGPPLGFLSGLHPGSLAFGSGLFCGLLRRFPGSLVLGGSLFCEPLRPPGGGPCGGLAPGGSPLGLQIGPRHIGLPDLGDLHLRYRLRLFDGSPRVLGDRRRGCASLRGLPILRSLDLIP